MLSEGQLAKLAEQGERWRATAVGDEAMVVRFVHDRFSADVVEATPAAGS